MAIAQTIDAMMIDFSLSFLVVFMASIVLLRCR